MRRAGAVSVRRVGALEAIDLAQRGYRVVDVRDRAEWDSGHVAGAVLLPLAELAGGIGQVAPDPATPLLLYCAVGARSARGAEWLADHGYTDVATLDAPIEEWTARGGAWEAPADGLTDAQRRRYARQVRLPQVGAAGQRRLADARVLVVGAGGLGSPAALYLAASGVGTIGIADDDRVDESNLHRQVLHATDRIGMAKVDSAERTLHALNPETRIVTHRERLEAENVDRLLAAYEVVVDGTDNLDARYVLNDAAVRLGTPVVHGSVYRWEGQVTTFVPGRGPCYRCMHPVRPPDGLVVDCDVAGVLGILPGIVGTLQAAETIKLLLGAGEPLVGRVLVVDALRATTDEVRLARDPACAACGALGAEATRPA